jgi:hypothetical protein
MKRSTPDKNILQNFIRFPYRSYRLGSHSDQNMLHSPWNSNVIKYIYPCVKSKWNKNIPIPRVSVFEENISSAGYFTKLSISGLYIFNDRLISFGLIEVTFRHLSGEDSHEVPGPESNQESPNKSPEIYAAC